MRILTRAEFLKLPAGTLFAKFGAQPVDKSYEDHTHGELEIKGDTCGEDFFVQDVFPWFEGVDDSGAHAETISAMLRGEPSPPLDYDCEGRDGLFDQDQLFAVWDRDDHQRLIDRLLLAFKQAHG